MAQAGVAGIHRRKGRGCTRRDLDATPSDDRVGRSFDPAERDRLWVMDVTEHPTADGKVYLAVVLDAFSRRVVGWSIADHVRSELVVDAVQMAIWRRRPPEGRTVAHSDHGSQVHELGLRPAAAVGWPAWLDGFHRRLLRQQRRRELLRDAAARAARRASLVIAPATRSGDLRLDRGLVQPEAPALLLQDAQPNRLRGRARCMMHPTPEQSAESGEAHGTV